MSLGWLTGWCKWCRGICLHSLLAGCHRADWFTHHLQKKKLRETHIFKFGY